jgi:hypothetical protein
MSQLGVRNFIIVVFVCPRGIAGAVIALMKMVRDWWHT